MIEKVAKEIAKGYGCTADSTYFFGPAPLINEHEELNETARSAVLKIMGEDALIPFDKQMGAEDFSVYMENTPGVFGFLGCQNKAKGICCVHHHPAFEVDEDVMPFGAGIYAQFAIDYLAKS